MSLFASGIIQHYLDKVLYCDFYEAFPSLSGHFLRAQRSFPRWATCGKGVGFIAGTDVP